jgi:two-component system response regulator
VSPANRTILLVEDNDDDVELTRRAFARSDVVSDIAVVRDGQEALDYLFAAGAHAGRDSAALPAVVLLDLKLPRVSGHDVLRHIRANAATKHLPVVILTTSKEESDIVRSYELGANSYVRKPVNFSEFIEATRQLGLYWLMLNERPPTRGGNL